MGNEQAVSRTSHVTKADESEKESRKELRDLEVS